MKSSILEFNPQHIREDWREPYITVYIRRVQSNNKAVGILSFADCPALVPYVGLITRSSHIIMLTVSTKNAVVYTV
jgi:hypothetical protein